MPAPFLRPLGRSGLVVSAVGLGGNNFGRAGTATESQHGADAVIGAALDAGVNLIDGADIYGAQRGRSEEVLGRAGRREGHDAGRWVLLDFGDLVVHVFHREERLYYGLERLWADCPALPVAPLLATSS